MTINETEEIRRRWRESARYWEKHRNVIERMYSPVTKGLLKNAELRSNDRILDLAGGVGEPSLTIANSDFPNLSIICTDVVRPMILSARAQASKRNVKNIQFCQCSGDRIPFVSRSFDVVVCRFGIMFFPDVSRALREILRVLRAGGRVSLAVWHRRELNPVFEIVSQVMDEFFPPEPVQSTHDPFRFSQEGILKNLMKEAGFSSVNETVLDLQLEEALNFEEFWTVRSEMSDTLRDKISQLTMEQQQKLYSRMESEFSPYFATGTLKTIARTIIVSGRN